MKKIEWLHTADLHLDRPISGWKGTAEQLMVRYEEHRDTFRRIISFVEDRKLPFLFIAGDFIEHSAVTKSTIRFVIEQLERIPSTQVFIAPGNHDPYMEGSYYLRSSIWPKHVHIFGGEWEEHVDSTRKLLISGRGFTSFLESQSTLPRLHNNLEYNICVCHGDLQAQGKESQYFPLTEQDFFDQAFDYVALGHIHKAGQVQLKNKKKTILRYAGSPEAQNWKELGRRTVTWGKLRSKGVQLEEVSLHSRTYEKVEIDISFCQTRQEILDCMLAEIQKLPKESYYRIQWGGRRDLELSLEHEQPWYSRLLAEQGYQNVWLEDETIPDFDLEQYRQQSGLVALFIERMELNLQQEQDEECRQLIKRAMYKGLEALLVKELAHL
ncbi:DNA repair exonuclease [Thermoactinomyces sp. DSM 45892]|uniref:metallophosphoesterase family protein n=1 Tax=Thermoactinomyces sp. DSM 45892 TaxID=1882753 RepID=UPI00089ACAA8|nr:DNA repair exonuclease [Thermoactinomyces sp. DSM 45892]SDY29795.1 DNA repair exonuclease SbcCD nuclease subunit [Thermoactinomyces sp. DSM 45892]